jgi:GntR family transcriptional regulator/MocR family aminotransferase
MHLDLDGEGPQYLQLTRAIRCAVQQGRLSHGSRLPATRELAQTLGLARNTVRAAYDRLGAEGLLEGRVGAGSFVRARPRAAMPVAAAGAVEPPSAYARRARTLQREFAAWTWQRGLRFNLQYGEPYADALLPDQWRKELARAALYTDLGYPPMSGLPVLKQAVCEHLRRRRALLVAPEDILIVAGTQQALSLAARVLLNEGDSAVIEEPGYFSARHTLVAHGARLASVPVDASGLVTDLLPERRPGLVYVTPSHQFPLGAVMSQKRRAELLRYAARHDTWLIEDDYDAEIRYDGRQIAPLRAMDRQDRVIFVGSFSKVLAPSMRLAYMVMPRALRDDFITAKRLCDMGCPAIEQTALAHFMANGGFERHVRRVVRTLRSRRNALFATLAQHAAGRIELQDSHAGMHVVAWLQGRAAARQDALIESARGLGVGLHSLAPHYQQPLRQAGLLLGFAALSPGEIEAAGKLLGRALDHL